MSDAADLYPAVALMLRETRVRYGPVPDWLGTTPPDPGCYRLAEDGFVLRTPHGLSFHYRRGSGVTIDRDPQGDTSAEELWFNGSVYAAIAAINGLVPIHASAIALEGRVHAFTGPSGEGKSTLAAALGRRGFALFCDDTLVLDLSDPDRVMCLPGHKRLKLTPSALRLTQARPREKVGAMIDKYYAEPPGGTLRAVLPLASLGCLEEGAGCSLAQLNGTERLARLNDDHYTGDYVALARGHSVADRFGWIAQLAGRLPLYRFVRPRDEARFDEGVEMLAGSLRAGRLP